MPLICLEVFVCMRGYMWEISCGLFLRKKSNHHLTKRQGNMRRGLFPYSACAPGCLCPSQLLPTAVSLETSRHPAEKFWPPSAPVLPQTRSVPMFSGLLFTCAVSSQEQHLHTWLTSLRCTPHSTAGSFALPYCPSLWGGPKLLFLNGRLCCQLLGEGKVSCCLWKPKEAVLLVTQR